VKKLKLTGRLLCYALALMVCGCSEVPEYTCKNWDNWYSFDTRGCPEYVVTVNKGSGTGSYEVGVTVRISADNAPSGQKFKNWTASGVSLGSGANSASTSFTMPSNAVTVTAEFESQTPSSDTYSVTVVSEGTGASGGGSYVAGATVTISAGTAPSGQQFKNWTASGVNLGSGANSASTSFTMPSNTVTVTANWEPTSTGDVVYGEFKDNRGGGKTYKTVKIGGKTWMAENLNYDTADGTGSWCYDDKPENCVTYGRLYNWNTAMAGKSSSTANPSEVRGVCPSGWHLPSRAEWDALETAAGGSVAGKNLKSTTGWYTNSGTDKYGFSALPGGYRFSDGNFHSAGNYGYWWTATEDDGSYAYYRGMYYDFDYVREPDYGKSNGFSVRCVGD